MKNAISYLIVLLMSCGSIHKVEDSKSKSDVDYDDFCGDLIYNFIPSKLSNHQVDGIFDVNRRYFKFFFTLSKTCFIGKKRSDIINVFGPSHSIYTNKDIL